MGNTFVIDGLQGQIYANFDRMHRPRPYKIPVQQEFVKMSSILTTSEEKTNGTRLARLLIDGGTHALREYLHSDSPDWNSASSVEQQP